MIRKTRAAPPTRLSKDGGERGGMRARPFAGLSPEVVLDAAASAGFHGDGRLFALNSYENRVYQLGCGPDLFVLKFYRPSRWTDRQIVEEHTFTHELAGAELPVAAPIAVGGDTLLRYEDFRFAVFPWMRGHAPELDGPGAREMLGRSLGRLHSVGLRHSFAARPRITLETYGVAAYERLLESELLPDALHASFDRAASALIERIERVMSSVGPLREGRLHGDCHLGNLLWNEQGPIFVDLDDCMNGPAIQDLWMLLSGEPEEQRAQWELLLAGYRKFADFDFRELVIIEALRGLRMLHHGAWVADRWQDPAFPRAFPWFGEARYWEQYIRDLLEQIALVESPPLLDT